MPCRITRRSPNSADLLVERNSAQQLWKLLLAATHSEGGGPAGYTALNSRRLEQGIPWFSYDFGEKQIPHEAGLEGSHISYTKGCYTGQEIVERVRSRGQVNRVRVTLQFSGEKAPAAKASLLAEGKDVGFITRAGFSPQRNAILAMAYLRREHSAPGTILQCGESTATVITPP
jgi:folate-binding protein YgfZ